MAIELRNCEEIHGIPVEDIVYLLNQYADDMNIASEYEAESVNSIFQKLEEFCLCTGFTLSYEKTDIYRLGPIHHSNAELHTISKVSWTNRPINVLGVMVCHDSEAVMDNYNSLITKTKATLCTWKRRTLSLLGKIRVINTLIASLFVYKMTVLPTMSNQQLKTCENYISQFLWNNKRAKIPLRTLQSSKSVGGLKLINLKNRDTAIKITWQRLLKKDPKMANLAYHFFAPELQHDVWKCNISEGIIPSMFKNGKNQFWEDVLKAWSRCQNCMNADKASRFLWYNALVSVNGAPVFWRNCYERGLCYVTQLYTNNNAIGIKEAKDRFGLDVMQYNAIMQAVPRCWRDEAKNSSGDSISNGFYDEAEKLKNVSGQVYEMLCRNNCALTMGKAAKWSDELESDVSTDSLIKATSGIYKVSNSPKLRSFQYRLLQRALVLNAHLYRWGMVTTNLCSFCNLSKETYVHLFVKCDHVKAIWKYINEYIVNKGCNDLISSDPSAIIFNSFRKPVINVICTIVKQYIYRQRCMGKPLNGPEVKSIIWSTENVEKYIAERNGLQKKHLLKWTF